MVTFGLLMHVRDLTILYEKKEAMKPLVCYWRTIHNVTSAYTTVTEATGRK